MENSSNIKIHNLIRSLCFNFNEGRDATEDFEDAGHSKSARELMEKYYIGEFDTSSPISTKKGFPEKFMQLKNNPYLSFSVAVVGISVVVGFLYLRKK